MTKLIENLKKIPKTYFSLNDIKKIFPSDEVGLKVAVSRLVKKRELTRIARGFYTIDISQMEWEKFSQEFYSPSYLSFEWALSRHNILNQKPAALLLATPMRSKKLKTIDNVIIYHHLNQKLIWGFSKNSEGYMLADKEKAFLDLAYLSLNGYAHFDPEEMNLELINKVKIKEYLKKFKNKRLEMLIQKIFKGMLDSAYVK